MDERGGGPGTRLETLWALGERGPEPPQRIEPAGRKEARRFWRSVARAEAVAFARWWLRRRPYTQADSVTVYRELTDTYPNALRRPVSVVLDRGEVGTAPLATFKRLSLEPILDLIRREGVATVLDFGCGWGINNQLELCRRLAMGLPTRVRLVAKEHPNMVSSRRTSYYDKLRGLLNVEMAHAKVPTPALFSHPRCRGVAVINSTAGFEAAMAGVPVVVLAPAEYDVLPVIERAASYEAAIAVLRRFYLELRRPLAEVDHKATLAYLAALLEEGFEADYQEVWTRGEGQVGPDVIADALERRLGARGLASS